jgi:hypothetical protein
VPLLNFLLSISISVKKTKMENEVVSAANLKVTTISLFSKPVDKPSLVAIQNLNCLFKFSA